MGASAAAWGWEGALNSLASPSHQGTLSPALACAKPGRLGCIRQCAGVGKRYILPPPPPLPRITLPLGVPIPQSSHRYTRGDSGASAAVWRRGEAQGELGYIRRCRGISDVPYASAGHLGSLCPKTVSTRPGGLGCILRCVGTGGSATPSPPHHPPTGRPYPPKRPASDPGDSCVSTPVWGRGGAYSPAPCSHWASLCPKRVCPRQGELLCSRRCVGTGAESRYPRYHPPTEPPYPRKGVPHTRGTRVYPPLCAVELGDWVAEVVFLWASLSHLTVANWGPGVAADPRSGNLVHTPSRVSTPARSSNQGGWRRVR